MVFISEKRRLGGSDSYFITEGVSCEIEIRLILYCFGEQKQDQWIEVNREHILSPYEKIF